MGKDKLRRFAENATFRCVIEPEFEEYFRTDHPMKGNWHRGFFGNDRPITLELGCGRGEYTVSLAERFPDRNFIGIDIKGARLWRGARTATDNSMDNVAFLRTRIEFVDSFFAADEVDEIWITFPDPQLRQTRVKKRLTSPIFLTKYASFLKPTGRINLKTDCLHLHQYSRATAEGNNLPISAHCEDIYGTGFVDELLSIQTTYESKFLAQGCPITYLQYTLGDKRSFEVIDFKADSTLMR